MRAARSKLKTEDKEVRALQEEAYLHLTSRRHTTESLAAALGTSTATAFRVVNRLRDEGVRVESMKDGSVWHYEVKDAASVASAWKNDPLMKLIGFIKGKRRKRGETVDDVVYDRG